MVVTSYQERIKRKSCKRIRKAIEEGPTTFTELLRRSKLSKAVFNLRLQDLQKEGFVKREYDLETKRVLIKFAKKALMPRERFLEELYHICEEPLQPALSAGLKRLLTDQVWTTMLEIADNKLKPEYRTWGGIKRYPYVFLESLGSEPYKALVGLLIYAWEKEFLSIPKSLREPDVEKIPERVRVRWSLADVKKMRKQKDPFVAFPLVEKAGVKREFDELVNKLGDLPPLNPSAEFLFGMVVNEHHVFLVQQMLQYKFRKNSKGGEKT